MLLTQATQLVGTFNTPRALRLRFGSTLRHLPNAAFDRLTRPINFVSRWKYVGAYHREVMSCTSNGLYEWEPGEKRIKKSRRKDFGVLNFGVGSHLSGSCAHTESAYGVIQAYLPRQEGHLSFLCLEKSR